MKHRGQGCMYIYCYINTLYILVIVEVLKAGLDEAQGAGVHVHILLHQYSLYTCYCGGTKGRVRGSTGGRGTCTDIATSILSIYLLLWRY